MTTPTPPLVERAGWMGDHLWALVETNTTVENAAELSEVLAAGSVRQTMLEVRCPSWCNDHEYGSGHPRTAGAAARPSPYPLGPPRTG